MTITNSHSEGEPDYVKMSIPIRFYEEDEWLIDPRMEYGTFLYSNGSGEIPECMIAEIPISAYQHDN